MASVRKMPLAGDKVVKHAVVNRSQTAISRCKDGLFVQKSNIYVTYFWMKTLRISGICRKTQCNANMFFRQLGWQLACLWVSQLSTQVRRRFTPPSSASWQNPASFALCSHQPIPLPQFPTFPHSPQSLSSHCHSLNPADPRHNLSHCSEYICCSSGAHASPGSLSC